MAGQSEPQAGASSSVERSEPQDGASTSAPPAVASTSASSQPSTSQSSKKSEEQSAVADQPADISVQGNNWLSYSDLMSESYPTKSKVVYLKAYKLFERYLKSKNQWQPDTVPTDLQVLNYFYFLKHELKQAPTTLWSTYARINAVMKRVFGVSLKSYTRVADVLKSYDSGHVVKQAGIFTPQQIEDFVSDPELSSKYWLVRKVVCLVGYYGGFRNVELKSLKFENCESDSVGYWFSFERSKQRGRLEATCICIPRRQPDWIPVSSDSSRVGLDFDPASLIDLYLAEVQHDLQCSRDELSGDFFRATHGCKGQKFTNLCLGKNTIGRVGVQVATELCLPRPEIYTGHCWRRSCGTSASDSGVNVTTLMAMMGWSNPKTAMVYVKKSRMTSLSLSMYLTNVQRSNVSNPFPRSPLEKSAAVKQSQVSKSLPSRVVGGSTSRKPVENSRFDLKVEDPDITIGTQELIREIEDEEMNGEIEGKVGESKVQVSLPSGSSGVTLVDSGSSGIDTGKEWEGKAVARKESSFQIPAVDPRMAGILQNMQNSGNVTINFNFDKR